MDKIPTVLVVDDLEENITLLRIFLSQKGYEVRSANSGEGALREIELSPPDIVLLDLIMPDIDGVEVCSRIKENPATQHIPVVMITGASERESNIRAIEAGADDYLTKPLDSILLDARIRSCLNSKRLRDQILNYQRMLENYNLTLQNGIRERTLQVIRTQQVTVFALAKLAESRDPETGEHLDRMRRYAREIARELATWEKYRSLINDKFIEDLYTSSPLHDIGKVGIPDRILLKPDKLSGQEFDIMKTHTTIGGETLAAADKEAGEHSFLDMATEIALYHHEKWDGTGYPHGIAGDEIPLVARIVALGDVYDALRSKRPYKEPFPHDTARTIIIDGKGKHFDPDVVEAFLKRERNFIEIEQECQDLGPQPLLQRLIEKLEQSDSA